MYLLQKKQITAIAALLLSCSSAFADTTQPPVPAEKKEPTAGYNASSRLNLHHPWNVEISASFLYWEALQDNMELGIISTPVNSPMQVDGDVIELDSEYKPGFQVGLGIGFNHDGWHTNLEYTQFHSTQRTYEEVPEDSDLIIHPAWLAPTGSSFDTVSAKWHLKLDTLDWTLSRTSLFGRSLTISPLFGLRAAWIDQKSTVEYTTPLNDTIYTGKSDSWAIGFKAGLHSDWMLGKGFTIYGNVDADLLYTRYTHLTAEEERSSSGGPLTPRRFVAQNNLNTIRPHCDIELGFTWGTYFSKKRFHMDLGLGYGLQIFWNQNMFRSFTDNLALGTSLSPNGDLHIHGLTASAAFAF